MNTEHVSEEQVKQALQKFASASGYVGKEPLTFELDTPTYKHRIKTVDKFTVEDTADDIQIRKDELGYKIQFYITAYDDLVNDIPNIFKEADIRLNKKWHDGKPFTTATYEFSLHNSEDLKKLHKATELVQKHIELTAGMLSDEATNRPLEQLLSFDSLSTAKDLTKLQQSYANAPRNDGTLIDGAYAEMLRNETHGIGRNKPDANQR